MYCSQFEHKLKVSSLQVFLLPLADPLHLFSRKMILPISSLSLPHELPHGGPCHLPESVTHSKLFSEVLFTWTIPGTPPC